MQSYIKAKKKQSNIFGVLKLIAFLTIVTFLIYRFTLIEDYNELSINSPEFLPLVIALLLVPVNWWIEFQKWKLTTKVIDHGFSASLNRNSFLAGMITGLLTPNMIGNFIGRIFYFPRKDRMIITLLTLIANQSQFMITLLFGIMSLMIIPIGTELINYNGVIWVLTGIVVLLSLAGYFYIEHVLMFFGRTERLGKRIDSVLAEASMFRIKVLLYSLFRYLVFISQFALVLMVFGVEFEMEVLFRIAQVYFLSALIPTLFLGKLGVRESVAILIFGSAGIPEISVLVASLSIWLINLIIPTLIAITLVKKAN